MKYIYTYLVIGVVQFFSAAAWASGEGLDLPDALEKKVNLVGLDGIRLFFAETYNNNLWLYAVYCTVLMAIVGVVIAFVTDYILAAMGLETHKIEHKE